ncbi:hypothetical protein HMPREF9163_01267 [Selenomonas sp. oral taxon 138 str. F0429]|nr:hypothetical protein HMPREF9163_01267 [Selenomonas sp. oral taxon 138 str. F0429]
MSVLICGATSMVRAKSAALTARRMVRRICPPASRDVIGRRRSMSFMKMLLSGNSHNLIPTSYSRMRKNTIRKTFLSKQSIYVILFVEIYIQTHRIRRYYHGIL